MVGPIGLQLVFHALATNDGNTMDAFMCSDPSDQSSQRRIRGIVQQPSPAFIPLSSPKAVTGLSANMRPDGDPYHRAKE